MPAPIPATTLELLKATHADLHRLAQVAQAALSAMEVARAPEMPLSLQSLRELADVSGRNLRAVVKRLRSRREAVLRAVRALEAGQRVSGDD